jgi:hypothetical protein
MYFQVQSRSDSSTLYVEAAGSSETLVPFYLTTLPHVSKDHISTALCLQ